MCLNAHCVSSVEDTCGFESPDDGGDAAEVSPDDTGQPHGDGSETTDGPVEDIPTDDGPTEEPAAVDDALDGALSRDNTDPCIDSCTTLGKPFIFSDELKQGLLLWADRTSLDQPGSSITSWHDRSGHGRDIVPLNFDRPPTVQLDAPDPLGRLVRIDDSSMGMATKSGTGLAFGLEDFTILVLARLQPSALTGCLFQQETTTDTHIAVTLLSNSSGFPLLSSDTPPEHALFFVSDLPLIPFEGDRKSVV